MPANTATNPSGATSQDVTTELPASTPQPVRRSLDVYRLRRNVVGALCLTAGGGVLWTQLGAELQTMLGR
jgi:hypothetical protein